MNLVESMRTMSSKERLSCSLLFHVFFVVSIMKHQFLKQLTLEMQFVREMVGFHGQVVDFEQLIRWKAGFSGQNHIL